MKTLCLIAALMAATVFLWAGPAEAASVGSQIQGYADWIVEFVKHNRAWVLPTVFVLAFGESIAFVSLILPFWGILVAIGALIMNAGLDVVGVWLAASVGAALGDWLSYSLGYHYREPIARMWPLSTRPHLIEQGHAFFERWGSWSIWLGRFSGPLRASVPIAAGIVRMNWTGFQVANWGSALVWAGSLLLFGDVIARGIEYFWKFI